MALVPYDQRESDRGTFDLTVGETTMGICSIPMWPARDSERAAELGDALPNASARVFADRARLAAALR
jgi:hypothetical protein